MAITVTATPTGASGAVLRVLVLTGATASGGKTATSSSTGGSLSITPNFSNSFIVWSVCNRFSNGSFTSLANNTIEDTISTGSGGENLGTGYYSGTVTSGSAVTAGATSAAGAGSCTQSNYEVPASGGSTPAIDASSPASVSEASGSAALTTASFTPPGGAVVVAIVNGAAFPSAWTVTDSSSMTWTKRVDNADGQQVWTATTAAGGQTVSGALATEAFAAPAGTISAGATISGALAAEAFAAPAGTVTADATIAGQVATIALAAPAGTVTADATIAGQVANIALAAPPGSAPVNATVAGAVAAIVLAAPAGGAGGPGPGSVDTVFGRTKGWWKLNGGRFR